MIRNIRNISSLVRAFSKSQKTIKITPIKIIHTLKRIPIKIIKIPTLKNNLNKK